MSDVPLDLSSLDLNSEPSPPIRYFDLLPPELIIKVVKHASSSCENDNDNDERDRRGTLRALCLTSRYLRSIARPLLLSHVELTYRRHIDRLVEKTSSDELAMIRKITFHWRKGMKSPVALARAATGLESLTCTDHFGCLVPFIGSNIKSLELYRVTLYAAKVPFFRFLHLQSLKLIRFKFYGGGIRFELPSLQHLLYDPNQFSQSTDPQFFFDQIAPTLVSVSTRSPTSLPHSIANSPSISRYRLNSIYRPPRSSSRLISTDVLHLADDTPFLVPVYAELGGLEPWIDLLKVSAKPKVLLLDKARVSEGYAEWIPKLEEVCQCRGIEIVWEERCSISSESAFRHGSAWFIKWSEERLQKRLCLAAE